jgi:8-oxo-dGTP pyrophosphatase MutT (NUDIX family)
MSWYPHVTVATVIEDNGRYLFVEEEAADGQLVFNQPAGHLEAGESLIEAAARETLEETGWTIEVLGVVAIGLYTTPVAGTPDGATTYYRTTFFGKAIQHDTQRVLDTGIVRALWLTLDEITALKHRMRSPLVPKVVEQYNAGHRYPLSMITL